MGVPWVFSGRVDIHMALSAGARLGPYEVLSLVGAGGMGEVYKARDTRLDRAVAIKLLPADVVERPDRRARFETEARAISSLSHPHICTLFDVGDEDGRPFLVMEYLEGETLDDRLTRGAVAGGRGLALRRADRRRARPCPRCAHRPSRSEAEQRDAHGVGREAARLRSRASGPSVDGCRASRRRPSRSSSAS